MNNRITEVQHLLSAALAAVEGRGAVRRALVARASIGADAPPTRWVVMAIGKAAASMTLGARDALGGRIARTLVITKTGHADPALAAAPATTVIESAHPVPDERSLAAGATLLEWVEGLAPGETPLFLVSGGSSSLVEVLRPGESLEALAAFNRAALASGEPIATVNAGRAQRSAIKGGALTARLGSRPGLALYIADVPGDDPAVIGSGLVAPVPGDRIERRIVASLDDAVEGAAAAARARGLEARIEPGRYDGDALELAKRFAGTLRHDAGERGATPRVRIWGGESTVQLPPQPGQGGRNQHLALAAARELRGHERVALLVAGTDGTDGPTGDAGAIVDGGTWQRILDAGIDPQGSLARADAGTALEAAGDLLHTGPTGTNVCDIAIGIAG